MLKTPPSRAVYCLLSGRERNFNAAHLPHCPSPPSPLPALLYRACAWRDGKGECILPPSFHPPKMGAAAGMIQAPAPAPTLQADSQQRSAGARTRVINGIGLLISTWAPTSIPPPLNTPSPPSMAPCWTALASPIASPSESILRKVDDSAPYSQLLSR